MSADKFENGVQSLVYEVLLWVKIRTPPDKDYGQTTCELKGVMSRLYIVTLLI